MAETFGLTRESSNKLWVETPFPVPNSVWGYFVLEVFPEFDLTHSHATWSGQVRGKGDIIRVLNREPDRFEISDGQYGYHWNHAYLPDDRRSGLETSVTGLVYVPEQQPQYLDQITADLSENGLQRADFLSRMQMEHRSILAKVFDAYARKMEGLEGKGKMETSSLFEELRRCMIHNFGYSPQFALGSYGGQIPAEYNNMRNYIVSEFLSNVSVVLPHAKTGKNTITPEELLGVSAVLHNKYQHMLR